MLEKAKTAITNSSLRNAWVNEQFQKRVNNADYYSDGFDIFAEEWDNLLILDGCRFDEFSLLDTNKGSLSTKTSRGAATGEWIRGNFSDRCLDDLVYVSGNVWYKKISEEINAQVFRFVDIEHDPWDVGTVSPTHTSDMARKYHNKHPKKRLLVHYLQPHQPFIGEYGRGRFTSRQQDLYENMSTSGATKQDLLKAYRENLQIVFSKALKLANDLPGKTVISADHGEMFGERSRPIPLRVYGHFTGNYTDELLTVPWFEIPWEERRTISSDPPVENIQEYRDGDSNSKSVDDRLRDLGYLPG